MTDKFLIIRDTREKDGFGYDYGETDCCAGCVTDTVHLGDYSIKGLEHLIFIDRKRNTSELATNLTEKRFQTLLEKAKQYKYKYLLLEFDLEDVYSFPINSGIPKRFFKRCRIKPAFIEAWITKISMDYGIQVIFAGSEKYGEQICYSILKRIHKLEVLNKEK